MGDRMLRIPTMAVVESIAMLLHKHHNTMQDEKNCM